MLRNSIAAVLTTAAVAFEYNENSAATDIWIHSALDCPSSQGADLTPWSCGLACEQAPLSNVHVVKDHFHDTYGIVAQNGDECLLALRGTKNFQNVVSDIEIFTTNPWGNSVCNKCHVHKGFWNAWASLQEQSRSALAGLGCSKVRITGHSMGGSMAALAAFDLSSEYNITAVYTYGQPRTGNTHWVSAFAQRMLDVPYFRIVDYKDPIPHLIDRNMFFQGWEHQAPEVYYTATQLGKYTQCDEIEQKNCSYQWNTLGTAAHGCLHCSYLGMNPCDCDISKPQCTAGSNILV